MCDILVLEFLSQQETNWGRWKYLSWGEERKSHKKLSRFFFSAETTSNNLLLKPNQLQRQAHSMDSTFYDNYLCFTPPAMRLPREQSRRSAESKESFEMELGFNAGVGGSQVRWMVRSYPVLPNQTSWVVYVFDVTDVNGTGSSWVSGYSQSARRGCQQEVRHIEEASTAKTETRGRRQWGQVPKMCVHSKVFVHSQTWRLH